MLCSAMISSVPHRMPAQVREPYSSSPLGVEVCGFLRVML